jgi:butyrate kinase
MQAEPGPSAPLVLVINPGSTSTKLALYRGTEAVSVATIAHPVDRLQALGGIMRQHALRRAAVDQFLQQQGVGPCDLDAVIGRGGLLRPIAGGIYAVNDVMIGDLQSSRYGEHASNLGAILAADVAREAGRPAFIADPPVVDEFADVARISGHPDIPRRSLFHALNQKAVAEALAGQLGKSIEEVNLIVVHLGGGITVGMHRRGRVVDATNALDGEGPFSPERTGGLPVLPLVGWLAAQGIGAEEVNGTLNRRGGLLAYLGTNDPREAMTGGARNDPRGGLILEAMVYQIAKEVGAMATVVHGLVDAIALTGGMAKSDWLVARIEDRVRFIAPVYRFPESEEMGALARRAGDVLAGRKQAQTYAAECAGPRPCGGQRAVSVPDGA